MGERVMSKTGAPKWAEINGSSLPIVVDGWQLTLFNEEGDLAYCAACVAPDGRAGTFENWGRFGADPTQLLSQWERAQLEQKLRAL
jgi:hypothetical protein